MNMLKKEETDLQTENEPVKFDLCKMLINVDSDQELDLEILEDPKNKFPANIAILNKLQRQNYFVDHKKDRTSVLNH